MALIHDDPYKVFDDKTMWGFCVSRNCSRSSFTAFNQFLNASARNMNINSTYIEYLLPYEDLEALRDTIRPGFIALLTLLCTSLALGILGIAVEYTTLGSKQLSHEETNFNNLDIPLIQEGNTQD